MSKLRQLLELDLNSSEVRLHEKELTQLMKGASGYLLEESGTKGETKDQLGQKLIGFLQRYIETTLQDRNTLSAKFAAFRKSYGHAVTEDERQELVLGFALALGASRRELAGDRRAFQRWFGYDAVSERYHRRVSKLDRRLAFVLGRCGVIASFVLRISVESTDPVGLWRRLELERLVRPLFTFTGNTSVRIASFRCLSNALQAMPEKHRESSLSDTSLRFVYRTALDKNQDTWLQCEALSLLASLSPASLDRSLSIRIDQHDSGDDLFVRRHAIRLLGRRLRHNPRLGRLIGKAASDPSPAVRQVVAEILPDSAESEVRSVLPTLAGPKNEPAVRASAALAIAEICSRPELFDIARAQLLSMLCNDDDPFVLRGALHVVVTGYRKLADQEGYSEAWLKALAPALTRLHTTAKQLAVRRWAAQAREKIWVQTVPEAMALADIVAPLVKDLTQGEGKRLRVPQIKTHDQDTVGRVMALLAQEDFGYDLERCWFGTRITRGHHFGFRLWRLLHEYRNPGTDKRQAFSHTTGRVFRGTVRAPSAITSELAQTKVPGEPLFLASEEGWRPYLPLVDEMISVLDQPLSAGPLKLYTSEGITEVTPPKSLWKRAKARLALTARFSQYARLRNWHEEGSQPSASYVSAMTNLGFSVSIRPYNEHAAIPASLDPAVARFFPATFALPGLVTFEDLQSYFFSVYENSLPDLALFITLMTGFFLGRHVWISNKIKRTRRRIPLSIGGWGTRGKSGTERLKAALFNALGHTVVSKTTGCEAMFLHGPAYGHLREMFLFRPYDKATIWEQANVIDIATRLEVDVFLWECMGLTPAYVQILQQQWMRDDIATITNTYPDHEDLQGPAGINIPQVMTNFIPKNSKLITSEEQMLPVLNDAAKAHNTVVRRVGWLEAGLLTSDLLARFPYAEHPFNIALVTEMAAELGIDADFAVKEMADRVVADLGVLKASPVAQLRHRKLEFVNGMSANERFGCLGNWQRMDFEGHDPYEEPGVWLSTIVNNRADRVPRSKVFASILVNDLSADCHFVIGTNLDGFVNYVREAWNEYVADQTLADCSGDRTPLEVLEDAAKKFRIPYRPEHVQSCLLAMLEGLELATDDLVGTADWSQPDDLAKVIAEQVDVNTADQFTDHAQAALKNYSEYARLAEKVSSASAPQELDDEFRLQLWGWFKQKLIVIENPHASGNQIINQVANTSPPGLFNRIMGLQNIKGTGLDFVYRWQAWETCHKACEALFNEDRAIAEQGLQVLAGFQEYNELCEETVRTTVERAGELPLAQNEWFQSELTVITSNLDKTMERVRAHLQLSGESGSNGLVSWLLAQVEAFLDSGDAIKRRKKANMIYKDLAAMRISHERAALELQALNKRQKGGWLQNKLEALLHRVR